VNVAPKTPYLHVKKYEEMGYAMVIYPPICITSAYAAMKQMLIELKNEGMNKVGCHAGVPFDELVEFLGLSTYRALEEEVLKGPKGGR